MLLEDGTGTGKKVKVDGRNRVTASTVSEGFEQAATDIGLSFNLNTGDVALTTNGESAVMYVKNNETVNFHIDSIAVGVGILGGTVDEVTKVTLVRNPTGGTVVSDATAVDQNVNRNFGSSKTFTADVYKGAEGKTLTGGADAAQFYMVGSSRLFAPVDFVLQPGNSAGIKIDVNDTTGGNIYVAIIGHLDDEEV